MSHFSFEKITLYTEILTQKVELLIFSLVKKHHKTTFFGQNFNIEKSYFFIFLLYLFDDLSKLRTVPSAHAPLTSWSFHNPNFGNVPDPSLGQHIVLDYLLC